MGINNSEIIMKNIIQSYPLESSFTTVGKIIMEVMDRIQFSMYSSPRGDIIVEPPLCDFLPSDFGMETVTSNAIIRHNIDGVDGQISSPTQLDKALKLFPSPDAGPYGPNYVILKRDTYSWESGQIDEKVYTQAAVADALVKGWDEMGFTNLIGKPSVVNFSSLIPLYGVRQAVLTPRGYIASPAAAKLYATICLSKLNADAHTLHVNHIPNIKLWINRPIYMQGRNLIGTTRQVNHNLTWGQQGDMSTTSDINFIRTWEGQVDPDGQMIFTTVNGYGTKLLDYATLFGAAPKPTVVDKPVATPVKKIVKSGLVTLAPLVVSPVSTSAGSISWPGDEVSGKYGY